MWRETCKLGSEFSICNLKIQNLLSFNKREDDFKSQLEHDDYLEMVEDLSIFIKFTFESLQYL